MTQTISNVWLLDDVVQELVLLEMGRFLVSHLLNSLDQTPRGLSI